MPKATKKTKGTLAESESETTTGYDTTSGSESPDQSESSSDSEEESEQVTRDDHGPPSNKTALDSFYKEKKRVDDRPVTCVIHKKTMKLFFNTM